MSERQFPRKIVFAVLLLVVVVGGGIGVYLLGRSQGRQAAAAAATAAPAAAPSSLVATVAGLGRFVIQDPDDLIQSQLLRGEPWEPEAAKVFEQYVKPGMSVVDMGAYNGVHTVRLAQLVGPTGHVYAFEPNPPAVAMLRENVRLNGVEAQTTVYPVGVSDPPVTGYVKLSDNPHNLGGAHMCSEEDERTHRLNCQNASQVKIELIRIDDDLQRWIPTRVGFVKIDVEGHEDRVIAGSRAWLTRDHPVIHIELWNDDKRRQENLPTTVADMIRQIEELGYKLESRPHGDDYLFVPSNP